MKIKADLIHSPERLRPAWCQVEKVVQLAGPEFNAFLISPQKEQPFLADNAELMHERKCVNHCLLVLAEGRTDGVLVDSEGSALAQYAAYLPQARAIVNAELERAVDHIVRQGTEHTSNRYWCVYCEELKERFALTIPEGSGLDTMLKDALERRPEVAAVEMSNGAIETTFHPEFCVGLRNSALKEKPDIRLRDIPPLLAGGLTFLRKLTGAGREDHAALLDAQVSEICPGPESIAVVLTDVEPEELVRFNEAYDAFQEAEQAMGPTM